MNRSNFVLFTLLQKQAERQPNRGTQPRAADIGLPTGQKSDDAVRKECDQRLEILYYDTYLPYGRFDHLSIPPFRMTGFLTQSPVPPCAWARGGCRNGHGADIAHTPQGDAEMNLVKLA